MITEKDLDQFHGTDNYYKDYLGILLTDGVKFLAENCRCYWIVSDIASVYYAKLKDKPFLLCNLSINKDKAQLTIKEDTNTPILYKQDYGYTDISKYTNLKEIKLYLIENVLLLDGEY